MGEILTFPMDRCKAPAAELPADAGQILFFTGIRYVPYEEPAKKRKPARRADTGTAKSRRKRKRA